MAFAYTYDSAFGFQAILVMLVIYNAAQAELYRTLGCKGESSMEVILHS